MYGCCWYGLELKYAALCELKRVSYVLTILRICAHCEYRKCVTRRVYTDTIDDDDVW